MKVEGALAMGDTLTSEAVTGFLSNRLLAWLRLPLLEKSISFSRIWYSSISLSYRLASGLIISIEVTFFPSGILRPGSPINYPRVKTED